MIQMSIVQHLVIKVFSGQWRSCNTCRHRKNRTIPHARKCSPKCCTHLIASSVPAGLVGNVVDWKFLFPTYPRYQCYSYSDCHEAQSCKLQTMFNHRVARFTAALIASRSSYCYAGWSVDCL